MTKTSTDKEHRPGYKKTKLGWLPVEWEVERLNQTSDIIDCKHRTPPYVQNGIPVVSPGSIKWGEIDLNTPTKRVTYDEYLCMMDHCSIDSGDLVLSRNQSVGIASYVKNEKQFVLGQDTVLIKPTSINSSFLYYTLQSQFVQRQIYKLAGGSTFSRINLKEIRKLNVITPTLPEQQKIAAILSTWDRAIALTRQLLQEKEAQKKGLMQRLLTGKVRVEGFEGDWISCRIGDILSESRIPGDGTNPYKRLTVRLSLKGIEKREVRGNEAIGATNFFTRKSGQFIYGKQNLHKGAFGIIPPEFDGYETTSDIPSFDFKRGFDPSWFFYFMSRKHFYESLEKMSTGTGSKRIKPDSLLRKKVQVPKLKEQTAIAAILTQADEEIRLLREKERALQAQKKGLMQRLLTGKIRVKP